VLELAGSVAGFYAIEALHELDDRHMELNYLFVTPEQIGRGCGRALIEHAKRSVRALGYERLRIVGDPNAAPFYEAAGARRVGQRPSESIAGRMLPLFEIQIARAHVSRSTP
jgi:GNAT superfamily N-acetyltransferase